MESTITLACDQCGRAFERRLAEHRHLTAVRGIVRTFCSRSCKHLSERRVLTVDIAAEYESGKTLAEVAAVSGISAEAVRRRLIRAGVQVRSKTAHLSTSKNPTKGRGHSPETKAKIREATVRQFSDPEARVRAAHNQALVMSEGRVPRVSQVENVVADVLDSLGVGYRRQVPIRDSATGRFAAVLDFMLNDGTALEVNGTFWHADPRAYPDGPVSAAQRHNAAKYAAKSALLKRLGIRLREVWEADLKSEPATAVCDAIA